MYLYFRNCVLVLGRGYMTHKQKKTLARKLQTRLEQKEKGRGIFDSLAWQQRAAAIAARVVRTQKKSKKVRILDDKGQEHQVNELIQSETLTLEI